MTKTLFILICLCFLGLQSTPAQTRKSDREHDGLIGAVKTVRISSAKLSTKSGNLTEGKPALDHVIEYEKQGNRIKETDYNDTEETFYPDDAARYHHPQINTTITYHYDAQGNRTDSLITESPRVDLQTRILKWVFKDDEKGNRISESLYSAPTYYDAIQGQALLGTYTHSYDDNGKRLTTTFSRGHDTLDRWSYKLDDNGNCAEASQYLGDIFTARRSYKYEYDSKGNWIKRLTFKWVTKQGQSYFEPLRVTYRNLTYY